MDDVVDLVGHLVRIQVLVLLLAHGGDFDTVLCSCVDGKADLGSETGWVEEGTDRIICSTNGGVHLISMAVSVF